MADVEKTSPDNRLGDHHRNLTGMSDEEVAITQSAIRALAATGFVFVEGGPFVYSLREGSLYYGLKSVENPSPREVIIARVLKKIVDNLPEYQRQADALNAQRAREHSARSWFATLAEAAADDIGDYFTTATQVSFGIANKKAWEKIRAKIYENSGREWDFQGITTTDYGSFQHRVIPVGVRQPAFLGLFSSGLVHDPVCATHEYRFHPEKVVFAILGSTLTSLTSRNVAQSFPHFILEAVANYSGEGQSGVGVNGTTVTAPRKEDQGVMVLHRNGHLQIEYGEDFFSRFDLTTWGEDSAVQAFAQFPLLVKDGKLPKQAPLDVDARPKAIIAIYPNGDVSYIRVFSGTLLQTALHLQKMGVQDAVLCDAGGLDNFTIRHPKTGSVIDKTRSMDGTTSRFIVLPKRGILKPG